MKFRGRRFLGGALVIALLILGSSLASADLKEGIRAWKVKDLNAVQLEMLADADGRAEITIGTNRIVFRLIANTPLTTGNLLVKGEEIVVTVYAGDVVTNVCRIPVAELEGTSSRETSRRFCYDKLAPVVRVTPSPGPNAAGWNNTKVTVTVTAEDEPKGSGIKSISYKIGTASEVAVPKEKLALSEGGRIATYTLTLSSDDVYNLGFRAEDEAGNKSDWQTLTVRIDTVPPAVSVSLSPTSIRQGDSIRVTVRASDSFSGVDSAAATDSTMGTISLSRSGDQWEGTIRPSRNGEITATARDKAGNTQTTTPASYTVTAPQPPRADFSCTPTSGSPPLSVQFTDRSSGEITAWYWEFGDGSTSTSRNPSHTYQTSGRYTVKLSVRGPGGSDSKEFCCVEVLRTGEVKVTLVWWSTADLDLYVVDPYGCTVYWETPRCASGGQLDVDANCDCGDCGPVTSTPVENIYWPTGHAPTGEYQVYVDYWEKCSGASARESFEVRVSVDGKETNYRGTVEEGKKVFVTSFFRSRSSTSSSQQVVPPTTTRPATFTVRLSADVLALSFSPDGRRLAALTKGGNLHFWDAASGKEIAAGRLDSFDCADCSFTESAFSPDLRMVAARIQRGGRAVTAVWDVSNGRMLWNSTWDKGRPTGVCFSLDSGLLVAVGMWGEIRVWDSRSGRNVHSLQHASAAFPALFGVSLSPDNRMVAAGTCLRESGYTCGEGAVKIWDLTTGRENRTLSGHPQLVWDVAMSPDGRLLASGGRAAPGTESAIRVWDVASGSLVRALRYSGGDSRGIVFSPDSRLLASFCGAGLLRIWEVSTGRELRSVQYEDFGPIAFSPDTRQLAVASGNTVTVLDVSDLSGSR